MGNHKDIAHDRFPEQGPDLGKRVEVCFHYDVANTVLGRIVRDDRAHPFRMVIRLDDGRHVLSDECQYSLPLADGDPRGTGYWPAIRPTLV